MKINFVKSLNLLMIVICFVLCAKVPECQSQLTFSPSWGKRASATQPQVLFGDSSSNTIPQSTPLQACNPKMESMLIIYRLISNEAQKMIECNNQQK
ncbi:hypothetical protein PVAND_004361 [Polypedilum vanderplanki]|uniref:Adipokinetic hormone 1 n=1 Tax=Polypedilum vanderplanki TaxID=319348 RepID=A0A9J6BWR6_POLVA|nr:hypothetical protein PVAND_004359 [Polypedilum vanderplanki]KAG5674387.1 hypothetical protein PVAND_004361 [Polypedilum vanderplanki]